MKNMWLQAGLALLAAGKASAFWRMQCYSPLVTDRVDPIVQPATVPSKHIHNIMGGSNFNPKATWADLQKSNCTSCRVSADKSIYWVPVLFFQHSDGELEQVNQKADMLVYYLPERGADLYKVEAFPKNFMMVAGDPNVRNFSVGYEPTEASRRQRGVGFNCLNYAGTPEAFLQRREMPSKDEMKNCVNGLRADIAFPSCWNGDLDSSDHRSHVAYPYDVEDGACPDTHPRRLVSILFETLWDVAPFDDADGQFVWSTGDGTGYGYHGDFMNGWAEGILEKAMNDVSCVPKEITATGGVIENCNTFVNNGFLQTNDAMDSCVIPPFAQGNFSAPGTTFPGCNPISMGPEPALECGGEEVGAGNFSSAPPASSSQTVAASSSSSSTPVSTPSSSSTSEEAPISTESLLNASFFNHQAPVASSTMSTVVTSSPPVVTPTTQPANPNVVIVVETQTRFVYDTVYNKRTAIPEASPVHKRHAHKHRRRSFF